MTIDSTTSTAHDRALAQGWHRDDVAPIWLQIATTLIDEIVRGEFEPGTRLPSEVQLARRFSVNRHTLRRATHFLAEKGYVRIRAGAGIFVRKLVLDYALHRTTRLSQNLAENGETAERELLDSQLEPATSLGASLQLEKTSLVRVLRLRSLVRQRPIALSRVAFPVPRLEKIPDEFVKLRSISAALASLGVQGYHRIQSTVRSRLPTSDEADWLSRPMTAPVLEVEFTNADVHGVPVESGMTVFAADAVQLTIRHPLEDARAGYDPQST